MAEALPETGIDKVELGYVRDVRVRLPKQQILEPLPETTACAKEIVDGMLGWGTRKAMINQNFQHLVLFSLFDEISNFM